MTKLWKRRFYLGVAVGLFGFGTIWVAGGFLSAPRSRHVGEPPRDLAGESVEFPSASGSQLRGWWIQGQKGQGVLVLLHGVRSCRLDMLEEARFLSREGYSILLFDFQAHGESPGTHITFGFLESRDVIAAIKFVREKLPGEKVGVIGISLGGAAAILASPPLNVDAMVLETVYPTIEQAVSARLRIRLGAVGPLFTKLLTWQLKPRLGCGSGDLRPMERVKTLRMPKLFITGTADEHTPLSDARQLFAAAAEPKEFWAIEGAAHTDLRRHAGKEYEARVLAFLSRCFTNDIQTR